jgi:hypothetical protein
MAEIIIDQTDLNLTITPNTTQLNVFTGGYACAQGNTTEFQYNNGGVLAGANGLTYNSGTQTTTAANLTVTNDTNLGAVGNVTITGGNLNQFLQTDGAGGLSFADIANANYANFAGTVLTNAQPNITSVGNLSNLTVTGNVTANYFLGNGSQLTGIGDGTQISNGTSNVRVNGANGNVSIGVNGNANILVATSTGIVVTRANLGNASNLTITGGINGYFLQTDGTGNLTWAAGGNVSGNGVPGGANTQIQFNDGGSFGGKAGFTFNRTTDLLNAPGAITAVGNITGSFIIGDGSLLSNVTAGQFLSNGNSNLGLYTSNGNATFSIAGVSNVVVIANTGMNVAGNITASNVYANSGIIRAFNIQGNTGGFTGNLTAVNIVSNLARGTSNISIFANAGNIGMSVNGTANIVTVSTSGMNLTTGSYTGNGSGLTDLTGANVTGTVANATYAVSAGSANSVAGANVSGQVANALVAGTVYTAAQPNITSVGTLTGLGVNGNITAANITANTGRFTGNGSGLSAIAGGNITGQVANALIAGTVYTAAQPNITSVGNLTDLILNNTTIRLGTNSFANSNAVAIGSNANAIIRGVAIGNSSRAGSEGTAIGYLANASQESIAIGAQASSSNNAISLGDGAAAGSNAIAIGVFASSSNRSVVLGAYSDDNSVSGPCIIIGSNSTGNSSNTISIGSNSSANAQNTIIINATGSLITSNTANSLFIKPIRTVNSIAGLNALYYNSTTGEIVVYVP